MTLYALGDDQPQLPGDGDYWVAPGAHVHATAERFRRDRPPYWARLPWA